MLELTEMLAERRGELLIRKKMLKDAIDNLAAVDAKKRLGEQELFFRHAATSDEQIRRIAERIGELELRQKEKIAKVLKIRRFKEGLEKLRVEAKERFIAEQERLEQKELDETAGISFVRKAIG